MGKSDFLFELIKSLDKQEKRYVQLSLKKNTIGNHNNYLFLFKAICSQTAYDEKAIKKRLTGLVLQKSFAVTKHYLYDWVLRTLKKFHSESTVEMFLADKIQQANLLFDKKLFAQCEQLVLKLLKVAQKHEKHFKIIELLDMELRTLHAQVRVAEVKQKAAIYFEKKQQLLKKEAQLFYLQKISSDNFVQLKTKWVNKSANKTKLHLALKKIKGSHLLSTQATIQYHQILSAYFFSINNSGMAFGHLLKLAKIFEKNSHLVNDYFNQYIALLNNMNVLLLEQKNYTKILLNIKELKAIKTRSVEKRTRVLERALNAEINVYKKTGEFEKAKASIEEISLLLENKKLNDMYRMLFHLDLFVCYFALEEYKMALKYINYFLSGSRKEIREDLQKTARLLNLIVHYKLVSFYYFESLLRRTRRFFKKMSSLDEMENLFLTFFNKIILVTKKKEKEHLFSVLQAELKKLEKQKIMQETYFRNFNFSDWADAESTGRKYADVVREKSTTRPIF